MVLAIGSPPIIIISTNIIPYEGLKQGKISYTAIGSRISTNIIPYEGFKMDVLRYNLKFQPLFQLT